MAPDATDQKKAAEAPTYHVDRLVAEASAFTGHPSHVVAGALASQRKQNFTLDEVDKHVAAFLKRPVEVDNPVGANYPTDEGDR